MCSLLWHHDPVSEILVLHILHVYIVHIEYSVLKNCIKSMLGVCFSHVLPALCPWRYLHALEQVFVYSWLVGSQLPHRYTTSGVCPTISVLNARDTDYVVLLVTFSLSCV